MLKVRNRVLLQHPVCRSMAPHRLPVQCFLPRQSAARAPTSIQTCNYTINTHNNFRQQRSIVPLLTSHHGRNSKTTADVQAIEGAADNTLGARSVLGYGHRDHGPHYREEYPHYKDGHM
jgi:hypothetical protein